MALLDKLSPRSLIRRLRGSGKQNAEFAGLSTQETFTRIYTGDYWRAETAETDRKFCSGRGSHADEIVEPYIEAVTKFLVSLPEKPDVLDLGCGDFAVGSRIRPFAANYIACDIVPPLIEENKKHFNDLDVDFRVVDLTTDELPQADVLILRQVLQHCSNEDIAKVVPQLESKFRYLVLTEHLPKEKSFKPNRDKPRGPSVRTQDNSGVVLTESPFNLKMRSQRLLTSYSDPRGRVDTVVYEI